jgi:hypothetical protein
MTTKLGAIDWSSDFIIKRHYKLMERGWQRTFHADWDLIVIIISDIDVDDHFLAASYRDGKKITVFNELPEEVQASLLLQATAYAHSLSR